MTTKFAGDGLLQKYIIEKIDGSPIHHRADYFVLRLDNYFSQGKENDINKAHRLACRKAILIYAEEIKSHLPLLAEEIVKRYS